MIFLLSFLASTVLAIVGYRAGPRVRHGRLRYVDAVHSALAPIIAGVGAALLALPLVAILPFVGRRYGALLRHLGRSRGARRLARRPRPAVGVLTTAEQRDG